MLLKNSSHASKVSQRWWQPSRKQSRHNKTPLQDSWDSKAVVAAMEAPEPTISQQGRRRRSVLTVAKKGTTKLRIVSNYLQMKANANRDGNQCLMACRIHTTTSDRDWGCQLGKMMID